MKERIREVIGRLVRELNRLDKMGRYGPIKPKEHPPVSQESIAAYEHYLQLRLPPSYRAFLELHNGYDWLLFTGHMLPIESVQPNSSMFDAIKEWKTDLAAVGVKEVLDGIVIGNLGSLSTWAYLDPDQPTEGSEMAVIVWDPEYSKSYPNLLEFLEGRVRICETALKSPPPKT